MGIYTWDMRSNALALPAGLHRREREAWHRLAPQVERAVREHTGEPPRPGDALIFRELVGATAILEWLQEEARRPGVVHVEVGEALREWRAIVSGWKRALLLA